MGVGELGLRWICAQARLIGYVGQASLACERLALCRMTRAQWILVRDMLLYTSAVSGRLRADLARDMLPYTSAVGGRLRAELARDMLPYTSAVGGRLRAELARDMLPYTSTVGWQGLKILRHHRLTIFHCGLRDWISSLRLCYCEVATGKPKGI